MNRVSLNVGCGTDYREGFVNIDASEDLPRVDLVLDLAGGDLVKHFEAETVDSILANDVVEHLFHWEAIQILKDFFRILVPGGDCQIRVPDAVYIIKD